MESSVQSANHRLGLTLMILASLVLLIVWCSLSVGYAVAVRHGGLIDSKGNHLGFNLPLTFELVGGLIRSSLRPEAISHWGALYWPQLCALMHIIGLSLVWRRAFSRATHLGFFALQTPLFFSALIGFFAWPWIMFQTWDGETIEDMPPIIMAAPLWLLTSWVAIFVMLKRGNSPMPTASRRSDKQVIPSRA